MKRYRIKPYDVVNDIWILQKRVFLCFWISLGAGSKLKLLQTMDELNSVNEENRKEPDHV